LRRGRRLRRSCAAARAGRRILGGWADICSKAFLRSLLWDPSTFVERTALPSNGEIHKALNDEFDAERYDSERAARYARRDGFY
jgi:hypothetical protein